MRASLREFLLIGVSVFMGILLYDFVVARLLRPVFDMDADVFRYVFLSLSCTLVILLLRKV